MGRTSAISPLIFLSAQVSCGQISFPVILKFFYAVYNNNPFLAHVPPPPPVPHPITSLLWPSTEIFSQACFGDNVVLVPKHHNKVNITTKLITWILGFPVHFKVLLHYTVVCQVCNHISKNILTLIEKCFIAKKG